MRPAVAPLEREGESPRPRLQQHPGQDTKVIGAKEHRAERVVKRRILPRRDNHEVGLEPPDRGKKDPPEDQGIVGAGRA